MAEHTKNGLMLIIIGLIIITISYGFSGISLKISDTFFEIFMIIGYVGKILIIIGILLIIIGRKEFSEKHEKFVKYGIIVFIVCFSILIITIAILTSIGNEDRHPYIIYNLDNYLYGIALQITSMPVIVGVVLMLFIYDFHNYQSKKIMLIAFVLILIISAITFYGILNEYKNLGRIEIHKERIWSDFFEKTEDLNINITKKASVYQTLNVFPSFLYFYVFYIIYNRIKNKEIKYREQIPFAQPTQKIPPYGYPPYTPKTEEQKIEEKPLPKECKFCGAKFFTGVEVCPKCGAYLK